MGSKKLESDTRHRTYKGSEIRYKQVTWQAEHTAERGRQMTQQSTGGSLYWGRRRESLWEKVSLGTEVARLALLC